MTPPLQLCTCHVNGLFLGLDVLSVQEVIRSPDLALVPLAPPTIAGLLNLRGQILTAIDLRRLLGFPPRPATAAASMLMILCTRHGQVALIVDSVGDVIAVAEDTFEPPPDTLPAAIRPLLSGVHKLPGQLLHVLNAETTGSVHSPAAHAA